MVRRAARWIGVAGTVEIRAAGVRVVEVRVDEIPVDEVFAGGSDLP